MTSKGDEEVSMGIQSFKNIDRFHTTSTALGTTVFYIKNNDCLSQFFQ
ncbi:Uncharacterised protein [Mycobacterium tuberculosis]|nr:Uncharacterised protein [Mycobacterium tuberculosis]